GGWQRHGHFRGRRGRRGSLAWRWLGGWSWLGWRWLSGRRGCRWPRGGRSIGAGRCGRRYRRHRIGPHHGSLGRLLDLGGLRAVLFCWLVCRLVLGLGDLCLRFALGPAFRLGLFPFRRLAALWLGLRLVLGLVLVLVLLLVLLGSG